MKRASLILLLLLALCTLADANFQNFNWLYWNWTGGGTSGLPPGYLLGQGGFGGIGTLTVTSSTIQGTASLSGQGAAGGFGSLSIAGGNITDPPGVGAAGGIGTLSVFTQVFGTASLTGQGSAGGNGTLLAGALGNVTLLGQGAAGSVGTVTVVLGGNTQFTLNGQGATGSVSPITVAQEADISLSGYGAAGGIAASLASEQSSVIYPSGVGGAGSYGSLTIARQQFAALNLSGQGGAGSNGTVTATGGSAGGGYTYYRTITINHSYVGSGGVSYFPVYVSFTLPAAHVSSSSGYDINFFTTSGLSTPLVQGKMGVDGTYNSTTGVYTNWVQIPSISSASDTVIYVAYGNSSVTTDQGSSAVWTENGTQNFIAVYHTPNGSTLSLTDATGLTTVSNDGLTAAAGPTNTAGAAVFSGNYATAAMSEGTTTAITISAWMQPASSGNIPGLLVSYNVQFTLRAINGSPGAFSACASSGSWTSGNFVNTSGSYTFNDSNWYRVVFTYDGTTERLYVNGTADGTTSYSDGGGTILGNFYIGQLENSQGGGYNYNGKASEIDMAKTARGPAWVTTDYNNIYNLTSFETLGAEQ